MGLLERHEAKKRLAEHDQALSLWQQEDSELREMLNEARSQGVRQGLGIALKKDESAFQVLDGSALIEPRRLPGHWEGRSQGFSFKVAKGVRYRVGTSKGHYVQGDEVPTPIDTGTLTITDQRVVFQGTKATREWAFSKLIGIQHVDLPKSPWTAIQVSNRQKTSGFLYTPAVAAGVRFRLDLAIAHYHGEVDEMIRALEAQLAEHARSGPADLPREPASLPAGSDPSGWFADPSGRHQYRYRDEHGWTANVADDGAQSTDPLE
jgi:hypothetical protein